MLPFYVTYTNMYHMQKFLRYIPFSIITWQEWEGFSFKCVAILSKPDTSVRNSQLRQTTVKPLATGGKRKSKYEFK